MSFRFFFIIPFLYTLSFNAEISFSPKTWVTKSKNMYNNACKNIRKHICENHANVCSHDEVDQEIIDLVHQVALEVGINPESIVIKNTYKKIKNAHVVFNQMCIDCQWLKTLPLDQQRSIIKHELSHIACNHSKKLIIFTLGVVFACQAYALKIQMDAHTYAINNTLSLTESFKKMLKDIARIICISSVMDACLRAYQRHIEKEADLMVANAGKIEDIQGLINYFKENPDELEQFLENHGILTDETAPITHKCIVFLANTLLRTHPHHEERIAYLEEAIKANGSSAS